MGVKTLKDDLHWEGNMGMDKWSYHWGGGKASKSIVFSKVTAAHDESLFLLPLGNP